MNINEVWKNLNNSAVLVLPLFNNISEKVTLKETKDRIIIPFIMLAFEHGLINTYLFEKSDDSINTLKLVFNEEVSKGLNLIKSSYYALSDMIVDSKEFVKVERLNDDVIFYLKIPEEHIDDVKLITESKYSKVSKEYKEKLLIRQKFIPKWSNAYAHYLCKENIPFSVLTKQKHLKEEIVNFIGQNFSDDQEYYPSFNKEKETFL